MSFTPKCNCQALQEFRDSYDFVYYFRIELHSEGVMFLSW